MNTTVNYEPEKTHSLISQIEQIAKKSKKSKLKLNFDSQKAKIVNSVSEFLGCTPFQAILFAVIFQLSFKNDDVSINDVSEYLDCSPLRVLERFSDIDQLKKLRLITVQNRSFALPGFNYQEYFIPTRVTEAIGKMDKQCLLEAEKLELIPLLDKIYKLVQERDDGHLTTDELTEDVQRVMKNNEHLEFVKKLAGFNLIDDELILYFYACRETINGDEEIELNNVCNKIWEDTSTRFKMKRNLIKGKSKLIKHDLIKLQDGIFRSDREIILTEKSLDLLLEDDVDLVMNQEKRVKGLIPNGKITKKKLFFNRKEQLQLDELSAILQRRNFKNIQNRLKKRAMPGGIAILFHGAPGTGKTESTYQIAYKTGRDIMMVDISDTKSMWFGESEKKIKAVFSDYKELLQKNKPAAILVFNEADAVFSKRKDVDRSAVGQTENAIQNIILQELEDFEGILIATTNLTNNFDKAFERRFLYKIEFSKPESKTRASIWKDKITRLTKVQAGILADQFELTGGNIDNVARKILMNSILHGEEPDLELIMTYCKQESFGYEKKKTIGF